MGKTLHPLVRPNVLELPRGCGMTSHSSHMKGTEPRPVTRSELSLTDGVPQQLTSQLRSQSIPIMQLVIYQIILLVQKQTYYLYKNLQLTFSVDTARN